MQQLDARIEEPCFICCRCRDVINKEKSELIVQFCMGGYEERTGACEGEESPLLEAVVRERLVKTAGCKRFSG
jgi:hypothetical protein